MACQVSDVKWRSRFLVRYSCIQSNQCIKRSLRHSGPDQGRPLRTENVQWFSVSFALCSFVCISSLCDWLKNSRQFLSECRTEAKRKPGAYFPALGNGCCAMNSDWLITLYASVVCPWLTKLL